MTIYYSLLILIGIICILCWDLKNKQSRAGIIVSITSLVIILIQGLRHISVGTDLISYIPGLRAAEHLNFLQGDRLYNYEIGYSIFTKILAKMNISDQTFLFIVAAIIIIPIGYNIYKNSKMPGLSLFIYITLGFFTFTFSGLRQSIALAISFFGYKYIKEKK